MFLLSWCYSREAGKMADTVQQSGNDEAPMHVMRGDILLRLQAKAAVAGSEYQQALAQHANDPAVLGRLWGAAPRAGRIRAARQHAPGAAQNGPPCPGSKPTTRKKPTQ